MDIKTGKLYDSYDDAFQEFLEKGLSKDEIEERLIPISQEQYEQYSGMNRAERRRATKETRRKAGKQ